MAKPRIHTRLNGGHTLRGRRKAEKNRALLRKPAPIKKVKKPSAKEIYTAEYNAWLKDLKERGFNGS